MFNDYPYLNLNDLNLDFILKAIREMKYEVTNFVSINAIKYADPIQWNITSQYEKNTIVIDPVTGTAYISVAPVPAGVALTRPEYWTVVFDLGSFVTKAAQNFTSRWESDTTLTATFPTNTGEWLVWGDVLYKALTNIVAGDQYRVGSNIEHFTIEDLYNSYLNTIASILAIIGDLTDLDTANKDTIVAAINEIVQNLGDLNNLITADKSTIVAAINEIGTETLGKIGDLSELETSAKSSLVSAINEADIASTFYPEVVRRKGYKHYYKYADMESAIYESYQGFTKTPNGYCAMLIPIENQYNFVVGYITDLAVIVEYDDAFNEIRRSNPITLYHGRNMTYDNGFLYVNGNNSGNTTIPKIVVVNYLTLAVDHEITISDYSLADILFIKDGYLYTGSHNHIEKRELDGTLIEHTDLTAKRLPGFHSVKPFKSGYIATINQPNTLYYLDENFNIVKVINAPEFLSYDGEIKDIAVNGNDLYIPQNGRTAIVVNNNSEFSELYQNIFKIDIFANERYIPANRSYANARNAKVNNAYVLANSSALIEDGSSDNPFSTLMMAIHYGYTQIEALDSTAEKYLLCGGCKSFYITGVAGLTTIELDTIANADLTLRQCIVDNSLHIATLRDCVIKGDNLTFAKQFTSYSCVIALSDTEFNITEINDRLNILIEPTKTPTTATQKYSVGNYVDGNIPVSFAALASNGIYAGNMRATYDGHIFVGDFAIDGGYFSAFTFPLYAQYGGTIHRLLLSIGLAVSGGKIVPTISYAVFDETTTLSTADVAITRLVLTHMI